MLKILLAVAVGVGVGLQGAFLGGLRTGLGSPLSAGVVNNAVGLLAMLLVWFALRPPLPDAPALATTPALYWIAGALGAFYVVAAAYLTPTLGVATTLLWVLSGQLVTSAIVDHYGAFGVAQQQLSLSRVFGLLLVLAGAALVVRE